MKAWESVALSMADCVNVSPEVGTAGYVKWGVPSVAPSEAPVGGGTTWGAVHTSACIPSRCFQAAKLADTGAGLYGIVP
jgi:hypothetical protein